jgi:energy-converting hydrogenase A subunit R
MRQVAFDLEGPLSPQDNAYDLMGLFPEGRRVFEVISRYDDLLTLEARPGYEPGDTLALIVPFLLYHHVKESDIRALAEKAVLVPGASELVSELQHSQWQVFCITTTYLQYSRHVTARLGISADNVAGTVLPLDQVSANVTLADLAVVGSVEEQIAKLRPDNDDAIKRLLDRFYWTELPRTKLGGLVEGVKPVGGRRKVRALERFAARAEQPLSEWVVVGDSITDFRMFQAVDRAGGLAVAFNANEYALPYATIGLASTDISDLVFALDAWARGRRLAVAQFIAAKAGSPHAPNRDNFQWLSGSPSLTAALELHKRIRRLVRQSAGNLG